jgi:hypothetical protein
MWAHHLYQVPDEFDFGKERANIQYLRHFAHTHPPHAALQSTSLAGQVRYPEVHEALCTVRPLSLENASVYNLYDHLHGGQLTWWTT